MHSKSGNSLALQRLRVITQSWAVRWPVIMACCVELQHSSCGVLPIRRGTTTIMMAQQHQRTPCFACGFGATCRCACLAASSDTACFVQIFCPLASICPAAPLRASFPGASGVRLAYACGSVCCKPHVVSSCMALIGANAEEASDTLDSRCCPGALVSLHHGCLHGQGCTACWPCHALACSAHCPVPLAGSNGCKFGGRRRTGGDQ